MSVLQFSNNNNFNIKEKLNKKNIIIAIIILILLLLILLYFFIPNFRNFITLYVFRKQDSQDKLNTISLSEDESSTPRPV